MKRFSAKLLFQFRVTIDGDDGKRRYCEERIVSFQATNAKKALIQAKRKGRSAEFNYRNSDGNLVHFEFIGVMELIDIGLECEEDEVWYEIKERLNPLERQDVFIPAESQLRAIRNESEPPNSRGVRRCN